MSGLKKSLAIGLLSALALGSVSCTRDASYYIGRGNRYFDNGQYIEATINYRKAIQKDPRSGEAYYRIALTELQQKNVVLAYGDFSRAAQLSPDNLDVAVKFGDLVLYSYLNDPSHSKKQYDLLTSMADRIAAKDPKSIDAMRFKGFLAVTDRKPDEAIRIFRIANSIKPMQPEIVLPLAQTLVAVKQAEEAEKMSLQALRLHPHYAALYNFLYYQYLNTNRPAEAEQILKAKVSVEPKEPAWHLELASHYARTGNTAEMKATLQHLLDDPKGFPQARFQIGEFYAGIGNADEALRQLNEGAKAEGKRTEIYQKKIAQLLANQGKTAEALDVLDGILKRHPDMADALGLHALLLMESGSVQKTELAAKELVAGLKRNPQDPQLHYELGRARFLKGDLGGARTELLEALQRQAGYVAPRLLLAQISLQTNHPSEALRVADQTLALEPDNASAIIIHSSILMALTRYDEAREELNRLIQEHPERQDAQLQLGLLNVAQSRFKEANEIFHKLYKPGSPDTRPLEGLVRADNAQHEYDRSIQLLQDELKHASPEQSDPLRIALAAIAMYAGKYDLAVQEYQELAAAHPDVADFHRRLGLLYNLKGDLLKSLGALQKEVELLPNDAVAHADYGYALQLADRKPDAIEHYRKSLALRPGDAIVSNNLAFLLADTESNLDEALRLAMQAQRQKAGDPGVADTVGWVYYKLGQNESALQIFRNLTMKYPESAPFHYHLAAVLIAKGEAAQAKEQLQKALTARPSKSEEEQIKALLQRIG